MTGQRSLRGDGAYRTCSSQRREHGLELSHQMRNEGAVSVVLPICGLPRSSMSGEKATTVADRSMNPTRRKSSSMAWACSMLCCTSFRERLAAILAKVGYHPDISGELPVEIGRHPLLSQAQRSADRSIGIGKILPAQTDHQEQGDGQHGEGQRIEEHFLECELSFCCCARQGP